MDRKTIKQLWIKHDTLVIQLKKLSSTLEKRLRTIDLLHRKSSARALVKTEATEIGLDSELASLEGLERVCEKELEGLKAKLARKCGPERILDLDKAIATRKTECEETSRAIKAKEKNLLELQKRMVKAATVPDADKQIEEVVPDCATGR